MRENTFPTTGTPQVSFRIPLGRARILSGSAGEVSVTLEGRESAIERFRIEANGDEIVVEPTQTTGFRWSPVTLTIKIGEPADVRARLASADLAIETALASLHVETASGDLAAEDVEGDVNVRSASGDIRVGKIGGRFDAAAASGDIRVEAVGGGASIKSASGDVHITDVTGDLGLKTASGDVSVGRFDGSWVDVKSLSGDVTIGVVAGKRFEVSFHTLSGDVRTEFPVSSGSADGGTGRIAVKTVSGDILIQGAAS